MNRFFGGLMIALGILIMTGSGLCSLAVIFGDSDELHFSPKEKILLPMIVGGIPFALGFGLFYGGTVLLRRKAPVRKDELPDHFDSCG